MSIISLSLSLKMCRFRHKELSFTQFIHFTYPFQLPYCKTLLIFFFLYLFHSIPLYTWSYAQCIQFHFRISNLIFTSLLPLFDHFTFSLSLSISAHSGSMTVKFKRVSTLILSPLPPREFKHFWWYMNYFVTMSLILALLSYSQELSLSHCFYAIFRPSHSYSIFRSPWTCESDLGEREKSWKDFPIECILPDNRIRGSIHELIRDVGLKY